MNVAIFLDEVNEFNGPLMFIPGSHKLGVLEAEHDLTTTSYPLWTINHETIRKLVERGGIIAPKGPAGSMILFHACLVHASTSNLSPWNRVSVYPARETRISSPMRSRVSFSILSRASDPLQNSRNRYCLIAINHEAMMGPWGPLPLPPPFAAGASAAGAGAGPRSGWNR
jgi:hypothetical protein